MKGQFAISNLHWFWFDLLLQVPWCGLSGFETLPPRGSPSRKHRDQLTQPPKPLTLSCLNSLKYSLLDRQWVCCSWEQAAEAEKRGWQVITRGRSIFIIIQSSPLNHLYCINLTLHGIWSNIFDSCDTFYWYRHGNCRERCTVVGYDVKMSINRIG